MAAETLHTTRQQIPKVRIAPKPAGHVAFPGSARKAGALAKAANSDREGEGSKRARLNPMQRTGRPSKEATMQRTPTGTAQPHGRRRGEVGRPKRQKPGEWRARPTRQARFWRNLRAFNVRTLTKAPKVPLTVQLATQAKITRKPTGHAALLKNPRNAPNKTASPEMESPPARESGSPLKATAKLQKSSVQITRIRLLTVRTDFPSGPLTGTWTSISSVRIYKNWLVVQELNLSYHLMDIS